MKLKHPRKIYFIYVSALIIAFVMVSSMAFAVQPLTVGQQAKLNVVARNKYDVLSFKNEGRAYNLNTFSGNLNDQYTSTVGGNIQVSAPQQGYPAGLYGNSETTVTSVNNGKDIVVGWNDASGFCFLGGCQVTDTGLSGYGFSTNGGKTFTDGGALPFAHGIFTYGDPWLANDGGNNVFYSSIGVNLTTGNFGMVVWNGHFTNSGNLVWTQSNFVQSPANSATNPNFDFYDKESITMAHDGSGAGYLTLTNFQGTCGIAEFGYGTITVWRTHDDGKTWQGPVVISPDQSYTLNPSSPVCGYYGSIQQASVSAIGPQGQLYVSWVIGPTYSGGLASPYTVSPSAKIMEATSLDGGRTFSAPVTVATFNNAYYDAPVGYNRADVLDSPRISVISNGPNAGRILIAYFAAVTPITNTDTTTQHLTSQQVYLKYSDDNGHTWKLSNVLPPVPATGVKNFWPVVVTESNGAVDIVYYQSIETTVGASANGCTVGLDNGLTRTGPANSFVNVYIVHSNDGGLTFSKPTKVTTETSNWCTAVSNIYPNFGDYIGASTSGHTVFAVWADGRNGVPDTFFSAITET